MWFKEAKVVETIKIETSGLINDQDIQNEFSLILCPFDNSRKEISLTPKECYSKDTLL